MNELVVEQNSIVGLDGRRIVSIAPSFNEEKEHAAEIMQRLGDLKDIDLLFNDVLVAKYIRENVSQHLVAPLETQREDQWQGVVGLVLKLGPRAFVDDDQNKFYGVTVRPGQWVLYRHTDGWDKKVQLVGEYDAALCRIIQDAHIRAIVKYPGRWW